MIIICMPKTIKLDFLKCFKLMKIFQSVRLKSRHLQHLRVSLKCISESSVEETIQCLLDVLMAFKILRHMHMRKNRWRYFYSV